LDGIEATACTFVKNFFCFVSGTQSNQKTLQLLGCNDDPHLQSLDLPVVIALIFDHCHMTKLVQNMLNEYQIIVLPGIGSDTAWGKSLLPDQCHSCPTLDKLYCSNNDSYRATHFMSITTAICNAVIILRSKFLSCCCILIL